MTKVERFRREHLMTRQDFARLCDCSEKVIEILEERPGALTVPPIAADIARVTGIPELATQLTTPWLIAHMDELRLEKYSIKYIMGIDAVAGAAAAYAAMKP